MSPRTLALFATLAALAACKAKTDAFYADSFTCDPNAPNTCGTTKSGQPMVCYSAQQLGGTGFCTEACDPNDGAMARSGVVCAAVTLGDVDAGQAASGAVLTQCAPSDPASCPAKLACYRTGLSEDKGVCLALPVCARVSDCPLNRPLCAADVVRMSVPLALISTLATDHLHCLSFGCKSAGTQCAPGEACIGAYLTFGSNLDELCVPRCDLNNACPPNFTCLQNVDWAPGAPPICFPGALGTRCDEPDDCLMGVCTDVGVEFKVCTSSCKGDADCKVLNTKSDVYFCANGHCLTPRPFQGSNCGSSSDCIEGQMCVDGTVTGMLKHGECRVPCDAQGKCPSRGGLPHVCLGANHEGGCYPSSFAVPCTTQADCVGNFKCVDAADDVRSPQNDFATHICTLTCIADADCDADSATKGMGFCQDGICRIAGGTGVPCDRSAQCASDRCDATTKLCVPALTSALPS